MPSTLLPTFSQQPDQTFHSAYVFPVSIVGKCPAERLVSVWHNNYFPEPIVCFEDDELWESINYQAFCLLFFHSLSDEFSSSFSLVTHEALCRLRLSYSVLLEITDDLEHLKKFDKAIQILDNVVTTHLRWLLT